MSRLDECTIYVFVRQDLPIEQQLVQASHAAFHAGSEFSTDEPGVPFMCVIGMPNLNAINRVLAKLVFNGLPHHAFNDSDVEEGVTAIATAPLDVNERAALKNYRLWKHSPGAAQAVCLGNQDGRANSNADVAQLREHPVSNGEVVGENPAISSSSTVQALDAAP